LKLHMRLDYLVVLAALEGLVEMVEIMEMVEILEMVVVVMVVMVVVMVVEEVVSFLPWVKRKRTICCSIGIFKCHFQFYNLCFLFFI
jgi:hypothetical protein